MKRKKKRIWSKIIISKSMKRSRIVELNNKNMITTLLSRMKEKKKVKEKKKRIKRMRGMLSSKRRKR